MSPIQGITLNKIEYFRMRFSSQGFKESIPLGSHKIHWIQIICGKNAEFYLPSPRSLKINFSTNAPNFLCLPDRVRGIPISLEILALNAEIPTNLFHENPPLFIN